MGNSVASKFPGVATSDESCCLIYGAYLEPHHVKKMSREVARCRQKFRRLSLLSCSLGDCRGDVFAQKLSMFLRKNSQLEWVYITGRLLLENSAQACTVLQAMETMTSLQRLSFCFGKPANQDVGCAFGSLIAKSPNLKSLSLSGISWRSSEAVKPFAERGLANAQALQVLDLSECRINDSGFKVIVDALVVGHKHRERGCAVRTLTLRGNQLTSKSLIHLAKLLSTRLQLERLDVGHTALFDSPSPQEIEAFVQALQHNNSLHTLDLALCCMDEQTMPLVMQALVINRNIRCLDMSNNLFIGNNGELMKHISPVLPLLQGLETIRVDSRLVRNSSDSASDPINSENDDAARTCEQFIDALNKNTSLTQLILDDGSKALLVNHHENKKDGACAPSAVKIINILQRNLMAKLMELSGEAVPVKALPTFMERRLRQNTDGKPREQHGPSVVFQLLDRHVAKMLSLQN
ncbi:hypothetical protein ACA910_017594 [Epithemia clementina (nom. ined.)]